MKRLLALLALCVLALVLVPGCAPLVAPIPPPPPPPPPSPPPPPGVEAEPPLEAEPPFEAEPPLEAEPPAEDDGVPREEGGVPREEGGRPGSRDGAGGAGAHAGPPAGNGGAAGSGAEGQDAAASMSERVAMLRRMASMAARAAGQAAEDRPREVVAEIPIELIPDASYAFVTAPGMRYRERVDVLFQVDPTATALEALAAVERIRDDEARRTPAGESPVLRGEVEATTGPWSRCMEAELKETTVASRLTARDLSAADDEARLSICELDSRGECRPGAGAPREMGLHPTQWRWRVEGVHPGRAQVVLRLYAVARRPRADGRGECVARQLDQPGTYRRIRTFERRMTVEVSTAERLETAAVTPWLWSLLFPPLGLLVALWQRGRARRVLP